ncbi:MAG: thiamine pyrophosphate-binding protein [Candidatus Doudnabacteria bacterium]|nr:thiamine pyrophosphate-binding protein [Candidatus Doudnabacteria bacterium]
MIKVSDYIFHRLHKVHGVDQVFMITGGGAMHLNDAIGRCEGLKFICNHHEQACAIAAEGYARTTGKLAAVNVTSGPGGTNTLTGVLGQWTDSVPVIYISGQVKFETTISSCPDLGLRQLGDQEFNIIDVVRPFTKFAAMVTDKNDIKKFLDQAVHLATHGRPGPVWLDIPMDVQGALVDEKKLGEFAMTESSADAVPLESEVGKVIELLGQVKRPVLVLGRGVRIAGARDLALALAKRIGLPLLGTFNAYDLIPASHPNYAGRIGTLGDRAGNFALQNSDLYISVGSRNNLRQVSYNWQSYARVAKKIVVDIDPAELAKPTLIPDIPILADAKVFLELLGGKLKSATLPDWSEWNAWCQKRRKSYPVVLPEYSDDSMGVHPYYFMQRLTQALEPGAVAVAGDGTACVALFQAGEVKEGQTIFWNSGCAAMGYDLPAAIGACIANKKSTVCIAGDGSLQLNIQELETVAFNKLPLKIFYLNNGGYQSIKQTQANYFPDNFIGCSPDSGIGFPDIVKVARAYGLKTEIIDNHKNLDKIVRAVLEAEVPVVCEVRLRADYVFSPKLSSKKLSDGRMISKPLEDMYPFLSREEFKSNMIIEPLAEE